MSFQDPKQQQVAENKKFNKPKKKKSVQNKNKQTNKHGISTKRGRQASNVVLLNCILELCQQEPLRRDPERVLTASASTPAMAAPQSSTDSLVPPLRRHPRRLVFDRRYGWM